MQRGRFRCGTDLADVRLARGFVWLVTITDWYSRRVLGWRVSNSMDASFCVDCLGDVLRYHGRLEVFDSNQSSRFNGDAFDVTKYIRGDFRDALRLRRKFA